MTVVDRIRQIVEQWFLTEPMLFAVYHTHRLTMDPKLRCPMRTGKGRIEYNPTLIDALSDDQLRDLMKVEMVRILLQHPYVRQPLGCKPGVQKTASDMVISPAYKLPAISLAKPEDAGLPEGQYYEWYAMRLNELFGFPPESDSGLSQGQEESGGEGGTEKDGEEEEESEESGSGDGSREQEGERNGERDGGRSGEGDGTGTSGHGEDSESASTSEDRPGKGDRQDGSGDSAETDYTALWEEDQFLSRQITDLVQSSTSWGMVPAGMVELIKKAAEGRIDFRGALRMFRASILSQKRRLTRMRPSRRFGFEQMGSHYEFTTRLLIAIDTSGSVGSEELARYLRIISAFFKYGIEEVDVLMFDTQVQGNPITIKGTKKHLDSMRIVGRGGTNFQAPVNYVREHPEYDGLVIITDGYAPVPDVPAHLKAKILWVIDNETSFQKNYKDLRTTGRVCLMQV
jgi:predicted metal-dependent peptidase